MHSEMPEGANAGAWTARRASSRHGCAGLEQLCLRYVRGRTLGVRRSSADRRAKGRSKRDAAQWNCALGEGGFGSEQRLGGALGLRQCGQVRMAAMVDMRRVMWKTFAVRYVPGHPVCLTHATRGAARSGVCRRIIGMSDHEQCLCCEQRVDLRLLMRARPWLCDPGLGAVIVYVRLTGFKHVRGQRERHSRREAAAEKSERAERAKRQGDGTKRTKTNPYVPQRAPNLPETRWTIACNAISRPSKA